ncbi:DUF962 domain-containing protein [Tahibacter amnicola]|uniref:DUF962 domain-containing protein n=1 Tax=Tahibacter amnicola TaxID=2976241 RepID=A0ABY6BFQ0_9GAMM|nr:Mpo1-like protein [Tahibacter amnicola]UXI68853.1 DUF962 domain-containing protein [Tahibacter amnicola]
MTDTAAASADSRREVDRWLGNYAEDHRDPTNILIHWVCVPLILWTVIAFLWIIPVPPALGRQGFWAAAGMFFAFAFYMRLSRVLALSMAAVFIAMALLTEGLYRVLGPQNLLYLAIGVFVVAWVAQFVGHKIEGKRPSFFTDLAYLLIGPAWITAKVLRRMGINY